MTDESASAPASNPPSKSDPAATNPSTTLTPQPWVSRVAVVACIGIFLGLRFEDTTSWEGLSRWGYLPAIEIWRGAYWALLSSAFVHIEIWHVAFNVYWLWVLGSRMERAIGSVRFLIFFVVSAFVSSSFQLAVSDTTGIGASGVGYAIFGFMWSARHRFPEFRAVLDQRTTNLFVIWLFGCLAATYLEIWEVGNAAHFSGALFGGAVGGCFVARSRPALTLTGVAALTILSVTSLVWCPWSVTWLSIQAYDAHAAERYDKALDFYSRIIRLDPGNAWAYYNRSGVHAALDHPDSARSDLENARRIDPSIEELQEGE